MTVENVTESKIMPTRIITLTSNIITKLKTNVYIFRIISLIIFDRTVGNFNLLLHNVISILKVFLQTNLHYEQRI